MKCKESIKKTHRSRVHNWNADYNDDNHKLNIVWISFRSERAGEWACGGWMCVCVKLCIDWGMCAFEQANAFAEQAKMWNEVISNHKTILMKISLLDQRKEISFFFSFRHVLNIILSAWMP